MRRFTLLAAILALGLSAQAAMAASPHFLRASARLAGDNLEVSFKEAGLGKNQLISYTASADFSRTDSCVNNGKKVPSDPKKTDISEFVDEEGTFSSGKNGSITGTLTLEAPGTTLECPPGQRATLISLTYSNVSISDTTNGETESIPGTFSKP
jgi:hypothetical protein